MIFKISTHKRGTSRYEAILERVKDLGLEPGYVTVICLSVPESRMFSLEIIARIEMYLTRHFVGQKCLQFGKITSAAQFWHEDGRLSGPAAIHILTHKIVGYILARKGQIAILTHADRRKKVNVIDRIYYPDQEDKTVLNIVVTGRYRKKAFKHAVYRMHSLIKDILSSGEEIKEPIGKTMETI